MIRDNVVQLLEPRQLPQLTHSRVTNCNKSLVVSKNNYKNPTNNDHDHLTQAHVLWQVVTSDISSAVSYIIFTCKSVQVMRIVGFRQSSKDYMGLTSGY